ncbi:FAD-dependent monooxygenase [Nocardioides sp.]|uniref:FAD-dependent monooxygenase n=1 Tax=Nocardioides sp. TaxID=35761 RepID=UPI0039E2E809
MTRTLIIGAGITGAATAHLLAGKGHDVEIAEIGEELRVLGSGITLISPALRALDRLGVLDECMEHGYGVSEFTCLDIDGQELFTFPLPTLGDNMPGIVGMLRPTLHQILLDHALAAGAKVRTGIGPTSITNTEDGVQVTFTDGTEGSYDLVLGADGLNSTVRAMLFTQEKPVFREQGCLRAVVAKPAGLGDREHDFSGDPIAHPGFTITGPDSMYVYCNVPAADTSRPAQADLPRIMRDFLAPYGGVMNEVRESITDPEKVNYALYETIVTPKPWHQGRVALIGDAAHSTTPQLAAGGAMCLEDVVVLGEELDRAGSIPEALAAFTERRYERCKFVVDTSVQIAAWQLRPDTPGAEPEVVRENAFNVLAQPF